MSQLIAEYRRLLTADESPTHLDEAMALARRVASGGHSGWMKLSNGDRTNLHKSGSDSKTARRTQELSFTLNTLPKHANERSEEIPEAQYSLLIDTLLLVFHQAYFALLPKAGHRKKAMLQLLDDFAGYVENRANYFQIVGLVKLEEGNFQAGADAFRSSVLAAHGDDHDFLSRVQMLWTHLMAHHRYADAYGFLIDTSCRVTHLDWQEFNGLLSQTFEAKHGKRQLSAAH